VKTGLRVLQISCTGIKVLKEDPDNFKDLSNLADCDVDVSVTAARRLVIKLYDSRGKIKAEDENLNKLRTRLASGFSFRTLKTPRLPIPNNNEVVSQPVTA
jgi:hypothetical protein